MDRQPTLHGDKLHLRPLVAEDREALAGVACDPLLWEQHPVPERAERDFFLAYFDQLLAKRGTLAVLAGRSGPIIGSSTYSNYRSEGEGAVEIGSTFLSRDYWGGDANREMKRLMLDRAFRFVALVEFLVGADNHRSRGALAKIGARQTDRVIEASHAGRTIPHIVYRIDRADWLARR